MLVDVVHMCRSYASLICNVNMSLTVFIIEYTENRQHYYKRIYKTFPPKSNQLPY